MSIIFITHDFDVAKYICDRLLIMYGGLVLEESTVEEIFNKPLHPYTNELMRCSRSLREGDETIYTLDGFPPVPQLFKDECPFVSRCKKSMPVCYDSIPQKHVFENRTVRCFLYEGRQ
jgi:peptide/nickel transport system ATP-binding protein